VQLTGVGFDDLAGQGQPQPHTIRLAGFKRLKQPIGDIRRHARTAVIDFDQDAIAALPNTNPHQTVLGGVGLRRIDGVGHQVQQQLFELDRIAANKRQLRHAADLDANAVTILAPEYACNLAGDGFDIDLTEHHWRCNP
jgi:hypothetical protein